MKLPAIQQQWLNKGGAYKCRINLDSAE